MKELLTGSLASMNFAFPSPSSFSAFASLALGCLASAVLAPKSRAQPPAWPDAQPVANGCYISTEVYLARLREQFPEISAHPETVLLPTGQQHTIAVVQWGRHTYLRDMFIGIAPVQHGVQRSFEAALVAWHARGGRHGYAERIVSNSAERWVEVQAAAQLLAARQPQIIPVCSAHGPIPVLCWTTPDGELALYEPSVGTAVGLTRRAPAEVAAELFGGGERRGARVGS